MNTIPNSRQIYTVSQLNTATRTLLEKHFAQVWITGEVSNLVQPASGHLYFSLKDERAQIRCALFRNNHRHLAYALQNGHQLLVRAQVSVYETRGDYQLIVQHVEMAGSGALQVAFEQLKKRLAVEGLFAPQHKKLLPKLPQSIGIVTSSTGAALRDILKILRRRFAGIPIVIYPTLVQGEQAAIQIANAIMLANTRNECDVLILARGGGSLEDLWPFNTERVARAIFNSRLPIITGIGHEIDFTIADFVADQRAATPSAAAEQISPDQTEWLQRMYATYNRLQLIMQTNLQRQHMQLDNLAKRLQHPGKRLQAYRSNIQIAQQQLTATMLRGIKQRQQRLAALSQTLHALSPLKTLARGFAIVTHINDERIIYRATTVRPEEKITVRLAQGSLDCCVEKIHK